ncbi:hypothetical protein IQ64_38565 [Streptomyces stelliscabiei]|nr:hypothetical protein IQ64_38565 [Streptomyces stelliscabiei]
MRKAKTGLIRTTWPWLAMICSIAALTVLTTPLMFTTSTLSTAGAGVARSVEPCPTMPAFAITTSTRPDRSHGWATTSSSALRSQTSGVKPTT